MRSDRFKGRESRKEGVTVGCVVRVATLAGIAEVGGHVPAGVFSMDALRSTKAKGYLAVRWEDGAVTRPHLSHEKQYERLALIDLAHLCCSETSML